MKCLILTILLSISNLCFTQNKSILDSLKPYESLTRELIKEEQFYYYEDDYRVYVWFKPSLVEEVFVIIYVNGIAINQQRIKITENNNNFEIIKKNIECTMLIFIEDFNYILFINKNSSHHPKD
jgi:hypothetical protein